MVCDDRAAPAHANDGSKTTQYTAVSRRRGLSPRIVLGGSLTPSSTDPPRVERNTLDQNDRKQPYGHCMRPFHGTIQPPLPLLGGKWFPATSHRPGHLYCNHVHDSPLLEPLCETDVLTIEHEGALRSQRSAGSSFGHSATAACTCSRACTVALAPHSTRPTMP